MREKKIVPPEGQLRITNQARTTAGMMYEFRDKESRLVLAIGPDETLTPGGWRVQASTERTPDGNAVFGYGTSKREALDQASAQWSLVAGDKQWPAVDWSIVVAALTTVRAL